ncbi:MAG: acyl carrier protein [Fimbriimonadaceae bacterium]|jgi:acyl carrier protein|nr:acyl carrier protein [Fimbriimonadaceae bacterium]
MADDIFERVKKVVCAELDVQEGEVTESSNFIADLGADSLDVVELVMAFEEEFKIDIPDDEVTKLATVGDAVEYIKSKIA